MFQSTDGLRVCRAKNNFHFHFDRFFLSAGALALGMNGLYNNVQGCSFYLSQFTLYHPHNTKAKRQPHRFFWFAAQIKLNKIFHPHLGKGAVLETWKRFNGNRWWCTILIAAFYLRLDDLTVWRAHHRVFYLEFRWRIKRGSNETVRKSPTHVTLFNSHAIASVLVRK